MGALSNTGRSLPTAADGGVPGWFHLRICPADDHREYVARAGASAFIPCSNPDIRSVGNADLHDRLPVKRTSR
jgi:hypothetical protein